MDFLTEKMSKIPKKFFPCLRNENSFAHLFTNFIFTVLIATTVITNFTGCCGYSFTGASVPEHLKTIAIPVADDKSGAGEPGLRELLTEKLTQKFIDDNTLLVADRTNADAVLECSIVSLSDAPAIITAGENVSSRRITITVHVTYRDLVKRITVFDKTFSNYGDYPPGDRNSAIDLAVDNITEDILLETVSGW